MATAREGIVMMDGILMVIALVLMLILLPMTSQAAGASGGACFRKPQGANGDSSPVDENFQIFVGGNPPSYAPGQQYNISLSCGSSLKFISFTLIVEAEEQQSVGSALSSSSSSSSSSPSLANIENPVGHFEIIDEAETRFSTLCENMVESSNTNTKSRVDVAWLAPTSPAAGCVLIKAAVLQHRNVWFVDDGFLTKRICPEEMDEYNTLTPLVEHCCACDEAKYEIRLDRKWSRNTHPKEFPVEAWRTQFSQIIGASHSADYRFWESGGLASIGLKELAEYGYTQLLEEEIQANANNGSIRTIIKAPGIQYRSSVLGSTLAHVRVDPHHHVLSLVSKVHPSPDWIIGVAGLELCLQNCTWIEEKELNLYPWDVGTDRGASYMSANEPQIPSDSIRRISSTFPSDVRSPFFDESGAPMKPLASLLLVKKKLYERQCESVDNVPRECVTHPWNRWSDCSAKCGQGETTRIRAYKYPTLADSFRCQVELIQNDTCLGNECGVPASADMSSGRGVDRTSGGYYDGVSGVQHTPEDACELTEWSNWSPCSKNCGKGVMTSSREFVNPYSKAKCAGLRNIQLTQTMECFGEDCAGEISHNSDLGGGNELFGNISPEGSDPNEPHSGGNYRNQLYGRDRQATQGSSNDRFSSDRFGSAARSPFDQQQQQQQQHTRLLEEGQLPDTVVEGTDPDQYNVVQEYCFAKPTASASPCTKQPLIVANYWFYDADDGACKLFTSDNCDESENRFGTLKTCEETCHRPRVNAEQGMTDNGNGYGNDDSAWSSRSMGTNDDGNPHRGRRPLIENRNQRMPLNNRNGNDGDDGYGDDAPGTWQSEFGAPQSQVRTDWMYNRRQPQQQQQSPQYQRPEMRRRLDYERPRGRPGESDRHPLGYSTYPRELERFDNAPWSTNAQHHQRWATPSQSFSGDQRYGDEYDIIEEPRTRWRRNKNQKGSTEVEPQKQQQQAQQETEKEQQKQEEKEQQEEKTLRRLRAKEIKRRQLQREREHVQDVYAVFTDN